MNRPVFQKMKDEGKGSKAPLTEAFGNWSNAKIVLIALFGGVMGQGVVWYTGQFYALFFMQSILKVDGYTANLLIAWSLLLGTGFFVFWGALSDKIGRKPIILAGCLIAALTFFPIFRMITTNANPTLEKAIETVKVEVVSDPALCGDLFNPVGTRVFSTPCDTARAYLAQSSVKYSTALRGSGLGREGRRQRQGRALHRGCSVEPAGSRSSSGGGLSQGGRRADREDGASVRYLPSAGCGGDRTAVRPGAVRDHGSTGRSRQCWSNCSRPRSRYTSMSLPYHIGNGWFGGLLPATAFAIVASTGDIYAGLWYPIIFAAITVVVGFFFLPETKDVDISAN
jgi:hypothetical protein